MMTKMKKILLTLSTLMLVACSGQQQQKIEDPLAPPVPTTKTEQQNRPKKSKPTQKPAKPFVPSAPGIRVSSVSVPGNYVAITFDDGPSASLTPRVLDILKRHGARATFFVLGQNASRNPSILARAAAEGHEIGNHTYSHIKMTGSSQETVCSEISRTNSAIKAAIGTTPKVMRPPYGAINSSLVSLMYHNYGLKSILWNVDTNDWQRPGVSVVVKRAVSGARPGSIILLHDIHSSTVEAVEGIVTGLKARGFELVTVSQLIAMGHAAANTAAPQPQVQPETSVPAVPATEPPVEQTTDGGATLSGAITNI